MIQRTSPWSLVTALTFVFILSCAGSKPVSVSEPSQISSDLNPIEQNQIPEPAPDDNTEGPYGPSQPQNNRVFLVLGPGLVKSYAAAGVLRVLSQEKIPVGGLVGTGVGALVAVVYATSGTLNEFEWTLAKFKKEHFAADAGFSLSGLFNRGHSEKLRAMLDKTFGEKMLEELKIPVRIGVYSLDDQQPIFYSVGSVSRLLAAALAEPEFSDPIVFGGLKLSSLAAVRPYPVDQARQMGDGPAIVVESVGTEVIIPSDADKERNQFIYKLVRAARESREELEQADLVLQPDLEGIDFFDFGKKSSVIYQGRRVAEKRIDEIKQLVGLNE